jgi:hypothetical protein
MKLTNAERLPCGCIIGDHGGAFVIQPCSPHCPYYGYVLAQSAVMNKSVIWRKDIAEHD